MNKLGKITNHEDGWVMQPYVQQAVEQAIPQFEKMVAEGQLDQSTVDNAMDQLNQYSAYAKSLIPKTGETEESYASSLSKATGLFGWATDLFKVKPRTEETKKPQ